MALIVIFAIDGVVSFLLPTLFDINSYHISNRILTFSGMFLAFGKQMRDTCFNGKWEVMSMLWKINSGNPEAALSVLSQAIKESYNSGRITINVGEDEIGDGMATYYVSIQDFDPKLMFTIKRVEDGYAVLSSYFVYTDYDDEECPIIPVDLDLTQSEIDDILLIVFAKKSKTNHKIDINMNAPVA